VWGLKSWLLRKSWLWQELPQKNGLETLSITSLLLIHLGKLLGPWLNTLGPTSSGFLRRKLSQMGDLTGMGTVVSTLSWEGSRLTLKPHLYIPGPGLSEPALLGPTGMSLLTSRCLIPWSSLPKLQAGGSNPKDLCIPWETKG
jgi:hypothetical protein